MPPANGSMSYRDKTQKEIEEIVKKDPSEIAYVPTEFQSDKVQMYAIKKNIDNINYITHPTSEVIDYIIKEEPSKIINIDNSKLTDEQWIEAIRKYPPNLKTYLWYRGEETYTAPFEFWLMFLIFATQTNVELLLGKFSRKNKTKEIPLSISLSLYTKFRKMENFLEDESKIFEKIPNEARINVYRDVLGGKDSSKKVQALIKLYED